MGGVHPATNAYRHTLCKVLHRTFMLRNPRLCAFFGCFCERSLLQNEVQSPWLQGTDTVVNQRFKIDYQKNGGARRAGRRRGVHAAGARGAGRASAVY